MSRHSGWSTFVAAMINAGAFAFAVSMVLGPAILAILSGLGLYFFTDTGALGSVIGGLLSGVLFYHLVWKRL